MFWLTPENRVAERVHCGASISRHSIPAADLPILERCSMAKGRRTLWCLGSQRHIGNPLGGARATSCRFRLSGS